MGLLDSPTWRVMCGISIQKGKYTHYLRVFALLRQAALLTVSHMLKMYYGPCSQILRRQ